MKIFFATDNKNDKDIEDFYFLCFILPKVCVSGWGKRFIKNRERHRDIKGHSNNKVRINFGKPKFTITSYCVQKS